MKPFDTIRAAERPEATSERVVHSCAVAWARAWLPGSLLASALLLLLATACGCGPSRPATLPAGGIVTLGGQPLADADVTFTPASGRPATARTDASGAYRLGTFGPADGALPGPCTVTVRKEVPKDGRQDGPYVEYVNVVPATYADPRQSPLKADVTAAGPNDFRFDLDASMRPPKQK
jgi:hypothetical protein